MGRRQTEFTKSFYYLRKFPFNFELGFPNRLELAKDDPNVR
jgi:hypothetical protein